MQNLDLEALTLGEVATIEDLSGLPISSVGESVPMGKMLGALVMVTKRRHGFPGFKFGDALALTMDEAMEVLGWNDDDDDTADADAVAAPYVSLETVIASHTSPPIDAPRPTKASKAKSPTPN